MQPGRWLLVVSGGTALAQTLLLDPAFPAGSGPDHWVRSVAVQPDGRVLIAGDFTRVHGVYRPGLARLEADGRLDPTFNPPFTNRVRLVRLAPEGSVLLAGFYTNAAGTQPGVAKLRPDGAFDEAFALPAAQPAGAGFNRLYAAPGGRFWVTGTFTNLGGAPVAGVARLNPDGAVDPAFRSPFQPGQTVSEVLPLPDGRVWVAGHFTNLGGLPGFRLARLLADGTVDATFQSPLGPGNSVSQLSLLEDGRVLARWHGALGGELFPRRVVRLLPDGALDASYPPTFRWGEAYSVGLIFCRARPDGSALLAGTFFAVHGVPRPGLARVRPDGAADLCFDPGLGVGGLPLDADFGPDGRVILAGTFTDAEGQPKPYLARLRPPADCAPALLEWGSAGGRFREDSGRALLSVVRRGGADRESRVRFEVLEGTARAGEDFVPVAGVLTFVPGARSVALPVELLADLEPEGEEQFTVRLFESENARLGTQVEAVVTLLDAPSGGQAGRVDVTFRPDVPWPVNAVLLEANLLWAAGGGWRWSGPTGGVRRLHLDGRTDPTFVPVECDEEVRALARLPDGRLLIGGYFATVNGQALPALARLSPAGEPDPDYAPFGGLQQPAQGRLVIVEGLHPLADGSVLVAGRFRLPGEQVTRDVVRIAPAGRPDLGWGAAWSRGGALGVRPQPAGGWFLGVADLAFGLLRLLPNGEVDPQFVPPVNRPGSVTALALEPGGSVLAAGITGADWPASHQPALVRLNRDGSLALDLSDTAGLGVRQDYEPPVRALLALPDGQVLAGGRGLPLLGLPGRGVVRLFPDGRPDPSFDAGPVRNWRDLGQDRTEESPAEVRVLAAWPAGGWLAGGDFRAMDGVNQSYLVRLLPELPGQTPAVLLALAANQVAEGARQISGWVLRRGDASTPASVRLQTVAGDAQPAADFEPLDLRLEFAPGEWARAFAVTLLDNPRAEPDRAFHLKLSEPSPGLAVLEPAAQAVTLLDDDVNVEFAAAEFAGSEDDGGARVVVVRYGAPGSEVRLQIRAGPETVASVIPALPDGGMLRHEIWVPLADDAVQQGPWRLPLSLEITGGGATPGARMQAEVAVADNDASLAPARGVAGEIHALAPAPGGGMFVAGRFTAVHGAPRRHVARLTPDFAVDPAFDPGAGPDGPVTTLLALADGSVVLAGEFSRVAGRPRQRLARLLPDGRLDEGFEVGTGPVWEGSGLTAEPGRVAALAAAPDGGLWVGGQFTRFDSEPAVALVRLDRAGRVDRSFQAPWAPQGVEPAGLPTRRSGWSTVHALLSEPDGGVLAGGLFHLSATSVYTVTRGLLRLNRDGTLDESFTPLGIGSSGPLIQFLARGRDGRLWAGGGWDSPGGVLTEALFLKRFEPDGRADPSFLLRDLPLASGSRYRVRQILPQSEGAALILADSPQLASLIWRVLADGRRDPGFGLIFADQSPRLPGGDDGAIRAMLEGGSELIVGGAFTEIHGEPRRRLARFDLSGTLLGRFQLRAVAAGGTLRLELPPDVPRPYAVETSPDLAHWTPLVTNAVPWLGWSQPLVPAAPAQFFRARQVP